MLAALTEASTTQLGPVVRALSPNTPWAQDDEDTLEVCLRAEELLRVPAGSRVLLRVRIEDLEWLNLQRPIFLDRSLRAVLWVDQPALDALVRGAVDLFDWVSRVVPVPYKALPDFSVACVRTALALDEPFMWTDGRLDEVLRAIGRPQVLELDHNATVWELAQALAQPGLPIVSKLKSEHQAWRIRMALALARHDHAWVARWPEVALAGMWDLHLGLADWDIATQQLRAAGWKRPALLAAWLDLDPVSIDWFAAHPGAGPDEWDQQDITTTAPARVLLRHPEEVAVARALLRADTGEPPEEIALQVFWSRGSSAWDSSQRGSVEPRLVRALRALGQAVPSLELVDAAREADFADVAATLLLRRWESGVDRRADDLVDWLQGHGQTTLALTVALEWRERADTDADEESSAAALFQLGKIYQLLGDTDQAEIRLFDSVDKYRGLLLGKIENSALERRVADVLDHLAELHGELGALERARGEYEQALAIRRALVEREPTSIDDQLRLSLTLAYLGRVLIDSGELDRARSYLDEALDVVQNQAKSEPQHLIFWGLVPILEQLGELHLRRGELERAKQRFMGSLAATRVAVGDHPEDADDRNMLSVAFRKLGEIHAALGEPEDAVRYLERSLELARAAATEEPHRVDRKEDLASTLMDLGDTYRFLGIPERARECLEESLQIAREVAGASATFTHDWAVATCLDRLGTFHRVLGDLDLAHDHLAESLEVHRNLFDRQPGNIGIQLDYAIALEQLGILYESLERPEHARDHYQKALDILRPLHVQIPDDSRSTHELAYVLALLRDLEQHDQSS